MPVNTDVVVIGAGILGCAIAYNLSRRGIQVALVDSGEPGHGTSGATFAWINGTSKTTDLDYHRLNAEGLEAYHGLANNHGADAIGLRKSGMLEWADPRQSVRHSELLRNFRILDQWGYPVRWLSHDEIVRLAPGMHIGEGCEALHAVRDAWLDVPVFIAFLLDAITASGGVVYPRCAALELLAIDSGAVQGVRCSRETFSCSSVVVATGVQSAQVLASLTGFDGFASRFPLQAAPGVLVTTPVIPGISPPTSICYPAGAHGFHLRAEPDGGFLLGADDTDGLVSREASPEHLSVAIERLLERLVDLIPALVDCDANRCTARVGVRGVPTDDRSIAGPMPDATGLYLVATHSGVTLAPVLGSLMADAIESGSIPGRLVPYGFDRF